MNIDPQKHIPILQAGKDYKHGRTVYVYKHEFDKWEELKKTYTTNYYLTSIYRAVYSLNAGCGSTQPRINMQNLKEVEIDGQVVIKFWVLSCGDVLIYKLEPQKKALPNGSQATGLYKARYYERLGTWRVMEAKTSMELDHRWGDPFHYAVVSGKFSDKEEAARKLVDHIFNALGPQRQTVLKEGNHFSLFWQNGNFKSESNVNKLTSLIQQAQAQNKSVAWLVHGEGAQTFLKAMDIMKTHPGPYQSGSNATGYGETGQKSQ